MLNENSSIEEARERLSRKFNEASSKLGKMPGTSGIIRSKIKFAPEFGTSYQEPQRKGLEEILSLEKEVIELREAKETLEKALANSKTQIAKLNLALTNSQQEAGRKYETERERLIQILNEKEAENISLKSRSAELTKKNEELLNKLDSLSSIVKNAENIELMERYLRDAYRLISTTEHPSPRASVVPGDSTPDQGGSIWKNLSEKIKKFLTGGFEEEMGGDI